MNAIGWQLYATSVGKDLYWFDNLVSNACNMEKLPILPKTVNACVPRYRLGEPVTLIPSIHHHAGCQINKVHNHVTCMKIATRRVLGEFRHARSWFEESLVKVCCASGACSKYEYSSFKDAGMQKHLFPIAGINRSFAFSWTPTKY